MLHSYLTIICALYTAIAYTVQDMTNEIILHDIATYV